MPKTRWLVPLAALGAGLLYGMRRRGALRQLVANIRAFDLPSARFYDWVFSSRFGGFYARVAEEVAAACPAGQILEVGSGPGRLAVRLAQTAPGLSVTAVDLAPSMVERARNRAAAAGLADRVRCQVADVAALPFPDESFDVVVSTLSFHHWADPARGLAEIHRVLKPGAMAYLYDMSPEFMRLVHHRFDLRESAAASPFAGQPVELTHLPGRLPLVVRLRLRRLAAAAS